MKNHIIDEEVFVKHMNEVQMAGTLEESMLKDLYGIDRAVQKVEENKINLVNDKTYGAACAGIEESIQNELDDHESNKPTGEVSTLGFQEHKTPENLGECADMLMNIKNERAGLSRKDKELKSYAGVINDHVLGLLEKEGLTSSSGNTGCVTIGTKNRYSVSDKEVFLRHIIKTEGYDLIGSAVSSAAMSGRVLEGEDVPGVNCFEQTLIKLTKRKV